MSTVAMQLACNHRASSPYDARGAFTLIEMMAVIALLGIMAVMATGAFRPESVGDLDGNVTAHRIAWDLQQARRRAISHGDNHALICTTSGGHVTSYTINHRAVDNSLTPVDATRSIPAYVSVTASSTTCEFNFEGEALAGYTFTVTTPHRSWTITVAQATGNVRVQ